jgi:hypothetical protein
VKAWWRTVGAPWVGEAAWIGAPCVVAHLALVHRLSAGSVLLPVALRLAVAAHRTRELALPRTPLPAEQAALAAAVGAAAERLGARLTGISVSAAGPRETLSRAGEVVFRPDALTRYRLPVLVAEAETQLRAGQAPPGETRLSLALTGAALGVLLACHERSAGPGPLLAFLALMLVVAWRAVERVSLPPPGEGGSANGVGADG